MDGARFTRVVLAVVCCMPLAAPAHAVDVVYTQADVALHATETDCWTVVRGHVYNLTAWVGQHPHGSADILSMCGRDATGDYETEHISTEAAKTELAKFQIGYLPEAVPKPAPSASPPSAQVTAPAAAVAAKRPAVAVTCVKGKQVKKFTAKKCPTGWKKN